VEVIVLTWGDLLNGGGDMREYGSKRRQKSAEAIVFTTARKCRRAEHWDTQEVT
jgi:hypothetical protein